MSVWLGTLLLLVFVVIELLAIRFVLKEEIPWREVVVNLNSGHILMWIGRGIEILAYHLVLSYASFGWVGEWPGWLQWVFGVFAWDFCFYWLHRLHHKIPLFWGVHEVHHQGEHFSLSLGIRNSWYSSITSIPFFMGLAIVGMPLEIFITVGSVHYFIQFYNHNRLVNKSGWLEHIFVTPSHHRVHHGTNPEYRDKNCGGTFVFWDKLFGTFQAERDDIQIEYGIRRKVETDNPFWVNTLPFLKLYAKRMADKAHQPSKAAKKLPKGRWVGLGGVLLFGLLLVYIRNEFVWEQGQLISLFALVFVATLANGGLADGHAWGWWLWVVVATLGIPLFYFIGVPNDLWFGALSLLTGIHGLVTLFLWFRTHYTYPPEIPMPSSEVV